MANNTSAAIFILAGMFFCVCAPQTASARSSARGHKKFCAVHAANGTGATEKIAEFQAYEGILKARDLSLWSSWIATGTTPGYAVKGLKYNCKPATGRGASCRARAKICQL